MVDLSLLAHWSRGFPSVLGAPGCPPRFGPWPLAWSSALARPRPGPGLSLLRAGAVLVVFSKPPTCDVMLGRRVCEAHAAPLCIAVLRLHRAMQTVKNYRQLETLVRTEERQLACCKRMQPIAALAVLCCAWLPTASACLFQLRRSDVASGCSPAYIRSCRTENVDDL